jgi:hypothetical protein
MQVWRRKAPFRFDARLSRRCRQAPAISALPNQQRVCPMAEVPWPTLRPRARQMA